MGKLQESVSLRSHIPSLTHPKNWIYSDSCTCGNWDFEQGHSAGVRHGVGCKEGIRPRASSLNFSCDFWHQRVNDNPWCGKLLASGQLHLFKESSGRIGSLCSGDWCWAVKTALAFLKGTPALPANPIHCSQMFCCSPDTRQAHRAGFGKYSMFQGLVLHPQLLSE